jgi:hypothetical protein
MSLGMQTYKNVGGVGGKRRDKGSVAHTAQPPGILRYLSQHNSVAALQ